MKKVSIVTVNFNNREGLIQTIESVRQQTFHDYEYIVIDGGSEDGSRDILEMNSSLFSYWCSERDGGIYLHILKSGRCSKSRRMHPEEIDRMFFFGNTLPHQCTFIKSMLFSKLGGYCTDYKIVSDWIFWYMAVTEQNATIRCVDMLISIMQPGGISTSPDGRHSEVIRFLMSQKDKFTENDWRKIIERCHMAYQLTCATRSRLGKLLVKVAKFLNK